MTMDKRVGSRIIPTQAQVDNYIKGLYANQDILNLDEVIKPHFERLLDAGYVPLWSCSGHSRTESGYFAFLLNDGIPSTDVLVKLIDEMETPQYDTVIHIEETDELYCYPVDSVYIGYTKFFCAYKIDPNAQPEDYLMVLRIDWGNENSDIVNNTSRIVNLLLEAMELKNK